MINKERAFTIECLDCGYRCFRISKQKEENMRCSKCNGKLEILAKERFGGNKKWIKKHVGQVKEIQWKKIKSFHINQRWKNVQSN